MKHAKQAKDPVCGMMVDIDASAIHAQYQGEDYYFCSSTCRESFEANPAQFLEPVAAAAPHLKAFGLVTPRFGSAGSGGAEYEPGPPGARRT